MASKWSWRVECADIWGDIAKERWLSADDAGYLRAKHNREILSAAHNIAEGRAAANY